MLDTLYTYVGVIFDRYLGKFNKEFAMHILILSIMTGHHV